MNLLLIIADTFRADHLGFYGSDWIHTPNLDDLASRSTVFTNHHAGSFPTMPARADMFLGKWTFTYRGWEPLPATEATLASILADAGYETVGVVDTPFYTKDGFAYDRGFKYFADLDTQRLGIPAAPGHPQLIKRARLTELDYSAPRTFALAEKYLEKVYDKPFFMLVDTWDPHEPWDPPAWYVRRYLPDYDGEVVDPTYSLWEESGLTADQVEVAHACYAGEVTMVDRWIGRLLERLDSLGVADDTIIAFTSDHGHYFGEHGFLGKMVIDHQHNSLRWLRSPLYREVTHIPLIVHVPASPAGKVDALTSTVDLMPTLAELLSVSPPEPIHGQTLAPLSRGETTQGREFVVTSPPLTNPGDPIRVVDDVMRRVGEFLPATLTTPEWTLLYSHADEDAELYRNSSDPHQMKNVASEYPDQVRDLVSLYVEFLEELGTEEHYLHPRRI